MACSIKLIIILLQENYAINEVPFNTITSIVSKHNFIDFYCVEEGGANIGFSLFCTILYLSTVGLFSADIFERDFHCELP